MFWNSRATILWFSCGTYIFRFLPTRDYCGETLCPHLRSFVSWTNVVCLNPMSLCSTQDYLFSASPFCGHELLNWKYFFQKSASLPECQKKYPLCGCTFTNFLFSSFFFFISYALEFVDLIHSHASFKYLYTCHLFSIVLLAPFPRQSESTPFAMSPKYFKQLKCLPPSPPPAPPRAPFHTHRELLQTPACPSFSVVNHISQG